MAGSHKANAMSTLPTAVVEIAKGVERHLAKNLKDAGDFVLNRSYAEWDLDLKNGDFEIDASEQRRIDVVSHTTDQGTDLSARYRLQFDCPIDIAIRQKLTQTEQDVSTGYLAVEEIDELMGVVQKVHVLCTKERLPGFDSAIWQSTRVVVAPEREHLRTMRQFTGIVRVVFRADLRLTPEE
jgi:hypothetical protein